MSEVNERYVPEQNYQAQDPSGLAVEEHTVPHPLTLIPGLTPPESRAVLRRVYRESRLLRWGRWLVEQGIVSEDFTDKDLTALPQPVSDEECDEFTAPPCKVAPAHEAAEAAEAIEVVEAAPSECLPISEQYRLHYREIGRQIRTHHRRNS